MKSKKGKITFRFFTKVVKTINKELVIYPDNTVCVDGKFLNKTQSKKYIVAFGLDFIRNRLPEEGITYYVLIRGRKRVGGSYQTTQRVIRLLLFKSTKKSILNDSMSILKHKPIPTPKEGKFKIRLDKSLNTYYSNRVNELNDGYNYEI